MSSRFSPQTVAILRNADRRLRSAERGDTPARYAAVKSALAGLAPLDAFYIAHFREPRQVVLAYIFDGDQRMPSEVLTYAVGGVTHWVQTSGKPYVYSEDDGRMLHRGAPIGDTEKLSKDCVFTPILDEDGAPVGLVSSQSLTPNAFDEEFVRAQTWLSSALARSFRADHDLGADLYELYPELDSEHLRNETDLLNQVSKRLSVLHQALRDLQQEASATGVPVFAAHVGHATDLCDRVELEVAELFRTYQPHTPVLETDLTPRESEIAHLIARDELTNAELAAQLHISMKTVKTHVGSILRKLGVSQRSAIAWTLPTGQLTGESDRRPGGTGT